MREKIELEFVDGYYITEYVILGAVENKKFNRIVEVDSNELKKWKKIISDYQNVQSILYDLYDNKCKETQNDL